MDGALCFSRVLFVAAETFSLTFSEIKFSFPILRMCLYLSASSCASLISVVIANCCFFTKRLSYHDNMLVKGEIS